ncbi:heavy-metal-associated domain-containing protein [Roseateles sp. BYS96W]|uniref:Heavy-metal-associated domain-containing protein n=1 Tax=Pelomonas nitida TaxID=3299027 RepID=A0ABW7GBR1_9BURK
MYRFNLPDMSCGHCVAAVTQALKEADARAGVQVDLATRTAQVDSTLPRDTLSAALAEAGYPPAPEA